MVRCPRFMVLDVPARPLYDLLLLSHVHDPAVMHAKRALAGYLYVCYWKGGKTCKVPHPAFAQCDGIFLRNIWSTSHLPRIFILIVANCEKLLAPY